MKKRQRRKRQRKKEAQRRAKIMIARVMAGPEPVDNGLIEAIESIEAIKKAQSEAQRRAHLPKVDPVR
jgi:hypothetical protein